MTNDTTTLNGALSELGETLASNITSKGVSASASDGLTTLANKVLQISGGGGSTAIYESDMTSDDGKWIESGGSRTVTYSSDGCNVTGTGSSDGFYKLDESQVTIPSEFVCTFDITKATEGAYSESTDFVVGNISIRKQSNQLYIGYVNGTSNYTMTFPSTPVAIKVDFGATVSVYVNDTLINQTWTGDYQYIGFKTYSQRSMTVKNMKIESNAPYSPCAEYIAEIDSAITYINGDGS